MKINQSPTSFVFFIIIVFSIVISSLFADTNLSGPGTLNKNGEYYRLTQDISASGTVFTISASNVTLDLNGHTITYNTSSRGAGIVVNSSNNTVKNGWILQGSGRSGASPGIEMTGSGHRVEYMAIKVNGIITGSDQYAAGIETYASRSEIHHVYVEDHGETQNISYSPRGIFCDHRTTAGFDIHDNILVKCHQGIGFDFVGLSTANPEKSLIYNNFIQHERSPGTKAPYAIHLAKTRNVDIYNNQIISDNGRGIMCDGYGQGVERGTDYITVYDNRIDLQYTVIASEGQYVENNVFGIYDRYSSGNNTFRNNVIIVDNLTGGATACVYVGSDGIDPRMYNLVFEGNTMVVWDSGEDVSAVRYAVADEVSVINNSYIADPFSMGNWAYHHDGGIRDLTESGNTEITTTGYTPAKPTGIAITRFFDSYFLIWDDNLEKGESQTYEYYVYRDGQKLDISRRGGTFFVDIDVSGSHTYSISAVNLAGVEGVRSNTVSTNDAKSGWAGVPRVKQINTPSNLRIQN